MRRDRRVVRDQRRDQAAAAARGQRQRLVEVVVRHQRADRAEGLDVVHRVVAHRRRGTAAASARRRRRSATPSPFGAKPSRAPNTISLPRGEHARRRSATSACCALRGERAHAHALDAPGRRRLTLASRVAQPRGHRVEVLARHDRAPDRGALLARLDRHLARDFLDEQVELLVVGRRRRAPRIAAVERIGLGVERDRAARSRLGLRAQLQPRCRPSR